MEISENRLRKIVRESVVSFFSKHPLIDDGSEEYALLDNPPFVIEEGLISTYPIDSVVNSMARVFNLSVIRTDNITKELSNEIYKRLNNEDDEYNGCIVLIKGQNDTDILLFYVGDGEMNKEIINRYMNKYGYFISKSQEIGNGWCRYQFEKKFDNDASEIVKTVGELYHICKMSLKEKIFRQGITPRKSQWKTFNNGPRCYFFLPISKDQIERWVMDFRLKKRHLDDKYMLLRIDVSRLPEDFKFYADPRMKNAVYSLQGIPPSAIEVVEENINGKMF